MFGLCATLVLGWLVLGHAATDFRLIAEIFAIKVRARLKIPADFHQRHLVVLAFWRAIISTVEICVIWGSGLMCAQLIKASSAL